MLNLNYVLEAKFEMKTHIKANGYYIFHSIKRLRIINFTRILHLCFVRVENKVNHILTG